MPDARKTAPKGLSDLTQQWDQLASERDRQLTDGLDISFREVVAPIALALLKNADLSLLLDIGSGTGHFAALISSHADQVIGIEPSGASVEIAKRVCRSMANVSFENSALEDLASLENGRRPTAAIALMVLMAVPDLAHFARSVGVLLDKGAVFVAVIPHPCFWPTYWGYRDAEWFDYSKEVFIEAPFTISKDQTKILTTHIHRPLHQYLTTFAQQGFHLEVFAEPMPPPSIQALYPEPWRFPRFAALKWVKG